MVFNVRDMSCRRLANFSPSRNVFLSIVLKAVMCLPVDCIVRPGILDTQTPLRHHYINEDSFSAT